MAKGIAEATTKIFEQLETLSPPERLRAVKAALTMLGEPTSEEPLAKAKVQTKEQIVADGFSEKGKTWINKNAIKTSALDEVFHLDGGKVELILAKAIGNSKRSQTVNTYILTGLAAFLETGTTDFADEAARKYCQHLGCYDSPNHSNYVKAFGNRIAGTKASGWKLTAPGLVAAAALLKPAEEGDE